MLTISAAVDPANAQETVSYGEADRQAVDFFAAPEGPPPPLVLFVHGGGWMIGDRSGVQQKPAFFNRLGYAFASTGYRLVPRVTVEQQAGDIAAAIRMLRRRAADLSFDPGRIVLIGHSAGAHLAALVATDPSYLGDDMMAISGVILLDGAGYDVPLQMASGRGIASRMYRIAFGSDRNRQLALSPVSHVGIPDVPDWFILHVANRRASRTQSQLLANRLRAGGARVEVTAVSRTNHGRLNRELGAAQNDVTIAIEHYLDRLFES